MFLEESQYELMELSLSTLNFYHFALAFTSMHIGLVLEDWTGMERSDKGKVMVSQINKVLNKHCIVLLQLAKHMRS